jgi:hypothetical protein
MPGNLENNIIKQEGNGSGKERGPEHIRGEMRAYRHSRQTDQCAEDDRGQKGGQRQDPVAPAEDEIEGKKEITRRTVAAGKGFSAPARSFFQKGLVGPPAPEFGGLSRAGATPVVLEYDINEQPGPEGERQDDQQRMPAPAHPGRPAKAPQHTPQCTKSRDEGRPWAKCVQHPPEFPGFGKPDRICPRPIEQLLQLDVQV